jgi:hypothetical protein
MRLVGDIERLIKKKIEIEPYELDDRAAAPAGSANASGWTSAPRATDTRWPRAPERAPRELTPRRSAAPAIRSSRSPTSPVPEARSRPGSQKGAAAPAPARGCRPTSAANARWRRCWAAAARPDTCGVRRSAQPQAASQLKTAGSARPGPAAGGASRQRGSLRVAAGAGNVRPLATATLRGRLQRAAPAQRSSASLRYGVSISDLGLLAAA